MKQQLKQGDFVKLTGGLSLSHGTEYLAKHTQGQILSVQDDGYTVVFEGHLTPVPNLTDHDVERDDHSAEVSPY
jgi:hypothetical protein